MAPLIAESTGAAGLGSRAAQAAVLLVWTTGLVHSAIIGAIVTPDGSGRALVGGLLLALVAGMLLTQPGDDVLGRGRAATVAVLAAAAAGLGLLADPEVGDGWIVSFAVVVGALLITRGSVGWGATCAGAVIVAVTAACIVRGDALVDFIAAMAVPVVALCLAAVWRLALRSIVREERKHRSAEAIASRDAAASAVVARRYRRELDRVRDEVGPLLERIASGAVLDEADHRELVVLEGAVRDRMRSPTLRDLRLERAIAARRRGVRVSVLWDAERNASTPVAASIAHALEWAPAGASVLVRTTDEHRGRVSIVTRSDAGSTRVVLDDAG